MASRGGVCHTCHSASRGLPGAAATSRPEPWEHPPRGSPLQGLPSEDLIPWTPNPGRAGARASPVPTLCGDRQLGQPSEPPLPVTCPEWPAGSGPGSPLGPRLSPEGSLAADPGPISSSGQGWVTMGTGRDYGGRPQGPMPSLGAVQAHDSLSGPPLPSASAALRKALEFCRQSAAQEEGRPAPTLSSLHAAAFGTAETPAPCSCLAAPRPRPPPGAALASEAARCRRQGWARGLHHCHSQEVAVLAETGSATGTCRW